MARAPAWASYAGVGLVLAAGAPGGWLLLRMVTRQALSVAAELAAHAPLYVYLTAGSAIAFGAFGAAVGLRLQRLERLNAFNRRQALTDALTQLPNARAFHERLASECARSDRGGGDFSLVMADLDWFKRLNDRLGHAQGDRALEHVGRILAENIRAADSAFRIGGEEFAVLCPRAFGSEAARIAERVRGCLEANPVLLTTGPEPLTASFGVVTRRPGEPPEALFVRADRALYAAKERGRNRVITH